MGWTKGKIIACCLLLAACDQPQPVAIDGDTFRIGHEKIRIWAIDAPELNQTCLGEGLRRYNCGIAARNNLANALTIGKVTCTTLYTDTYGRKVSQCSAGSWDIGTIMVRSGWALDYARYSGGHYRDDEAFAREQKRGIHEGPFTVPEDYRIKHQR